MKKHIYACIALTLLGFAVYANSLNAPFIWDDTALVVENTAIRSFSNLPAVFVTPLSSNGSTFFRPLQTFSYMIDYAVYALKPYGYRLTNVLLHITCACACYAFLLTLSMPAGVSLTASLFFLVSPLWVESVTYISGRADILMALCALCASIACIRRAPVYAGIFYALSLLSKETALVLPLALTSYFFICEPTQRRWWKNTLILWALAAAYLGWRAYVIPLGNFAHTVPLYTRAACAIQSLGEYAALLLFPANLHMSYTVTLPNTFFEPSVLAGLAFCALGIMLFNILRTAHKPLAFLIGWFFIWWLPQSGVIPINAYFAEHFIYTASIGWFCMAAWYIAHIRHTHLRLALIAAILISHGSVAAAYNTLWHNPIQFYEHIMRLSPNSFSAYNNAGVLYLNAGRLEEAGRAISHALSIQPDFADAQLNLARYYYLKGDLPRAQGLAKTVIKEHPHHIHAWNFLGTFYFRNNDLVRARQCFVMAARLRPEYAPLWLDLYSLYAATNQTQKAEKIRARIARLDAHTLAQLELSDALAAFARNEPARALQHIDTAITQHPQRGELHNVRGIILKKLNNFSEAKSSFLAAAAYNTQDSRPYLNLGTLEAQQHNTAAARVYFEKAIRVNPSHSDAYCNMGFLALQEKNIPEAQRWFKKTLAVEPGHMLAQRYQAYTQRQNN